MARKTKIIATLGPAVASAAGVLSLVEAGMDVARLNFSHGDYDTHRAFATWVREAADRAGRDVGLLQDIQGPRIRVGTFPGGSVDIAEGEELKLLAGSGTAGPGEIYIDHLAAAQDLSVGHRVAIADGLVRLEVSRIEAGNIYARVRTSQKLADHKGVAFPDTTLDLPPITPKDERDIEFGLELDVDLLAASFVATGDDIGVVRKLAGDVPVIAKIERTVAYENLDDILSQSSGAMVARGDLGVELTLERVPLVQKDILRRTNIAGRISITATEMLESMTHSPRPTRAEVADVANAVLDGTDAVMLSGETAVGEYPTKTIEVMDRVCREMEQGMDIGAAAVGFLKNENPFPSAVAKACVEAADSLDLPAIVAFSESGATARLISKYRPKARILCFTANPKTCAQMTIYWGVEPLHIDRFDTTDEMITRASSAAAERGLVKEGDAIALVAGIPPNQAASTNLIKLHVIGSESTGTPSTKGS
ncbi:MAG: pyruvate kinase [Acidimicrobiia bacterium]|nr:pyruvate kinase [Acidimicrobiia bacterium]